MAKGLQTDESNKISAKASFTMLTLALLFVIALLFSFATIILTAVGMLPTGVAYIIDRTEGKQNTQAVGWLNFAGLWPYLWELWTGQHTIANAMSMLGDVFAWLVIYGAASFGWAIFILLPPVMVQVLNVLAEKRVETLRENQRKIIEEWGKEVAEVDISKKTKGVISGDGVEMMEDIDGDMEEMQDLSQSQESAPPPPAA